MTASGSFFNVFSISRHFLSLIGVACTTGGFLGFAGVDAGATSFSLPLLDVLSARCGLGGASVAFFLAGIETFGVTCACGAGFG